MSVLEPRLIIDPEFRQRCGKVLQEWQSGQLSFKKAVDAIRGLLDEASREAHAANQGHACYVLGYMNFYQSDYNTSIQYFKQAHEFFEKIDHLDYLTRCDIAIGDAFRQKGDFARAREHFHTGHEKAGKLGNITLQTTAYANEGLMLFAMGDYKSARESLETAVRLAGTWPEEPSLEAHRAELLCEIYYALSMIHLEDGDPSTAWVDAKLSLEMSRTIDQKRLIGFANRTMGEVLTALGRPPHEMDSEVSNNPDYYFRISTDAFKQAEVESEMARTIHAHARSLAKRGQRVQAARKLQQAAMIFVKLGMVDDVTKTTETQSRIY